MRERERGTYSYYSYYSRRVVSCRRHLLLLESVYCTVLLVVAALVDVCVGVGVGVVVAAAVVS